MRESSAQIRLVVPEGAARPVDRARRRRRSRRPPAAWSFLAFDRESPEPLYLQLTNAIREAILCGRLAPGMRLPSTRAMAADLGVSRNTAANAFEALIAEGYIEGRLGSGTYVADVLPDDCVAAAPAAPEPRAPRATRPRISRRGERLAAAAAGLSVGGHAGAAFRMATPALDMFPYATWSRIAARGRGLAQHRLLGHGDPAGFRPLREAIAEYLRVARVARCDADQVLVVAGAQQGIALAARMLLDRGDEAWLEEPGYPGARLALEGAGASVVPVPVDAEGIDVEAGVALAPAARLAYVTPAHQFPLGVTMSDARRAALLEWARREGAWILEDDYDSEYRYGSRPVASLQGRDTSDRVLLLGTFGKVLFPSLRLAYLVLPRDLVDPLAGARIGDVPPTFEQAVLADFIGEGHFSAHIRRMRALYAERQATVRAELLRRLGGLLEVSAADAGMFLLGRLPERLDDAEVSRAAAAHGVEAQALSAFCLGSRKENGLLLGYACVGPREARVGAARLASAVASLLD